MNYHKDHCLIRAIGVANLARRLECSVQRVQNWMYRGIPDKVRKEHPQKFRKN